MMIKKILRDRVKRGVGRGFKKRVNRGPTLKFYCRPKAQEKQHFGKSHFYCHRFFPGNTVTIILDNYPPSTLQGVGLGCRKNAKIIVGENYCHFGASYFNIRIQWNAGTGCVSECVPKTPACRGLRVCPSKRSSLPNPSKGPRRTTNTARSKFT